MHTAPANPLWFRRLGWAALIVVHLVILAGGVVRATGSGMGCPDWPRCFGQYIPPTHASQLPADYRTRYATQLHGVEEFNAAKTWTEYINRLLGALAGLVVVAWVASAVKKRVWFLWSALALVLIGITAWMGKVVVERNLHGSTVTLHMLLALAVVAAILMGLHAAGAFAAGSKANPAPVGLRILALGGLQMSLLQLVLGTQVRQALDAAPEQAWTTLTLTTVAGVPLELHQTSALLLTAVMVLLARRLWFMAGYRTLAQVLLALPVVMTVMGVVLKYAGLPAVLQPLHLLGGALTVTCTLACVFRLWLPVKDAAPVHLNWIAARA